MSSAFDRRALETLSTEVTDLMWRVHRAQEMIRLVERTDDAHALRNFIALAPFANPECLPPFARPLPGGQLSPPPSTQRTPRPAPPGIPSPRRPPAVG